MHAYNTVVVGNGLLGSAAARYLSEWDNSVAIIGPSEPANHSRHEGVFSSHYDQGRLTRQFSQDPIWAVIGRRAVENYAALQAKSGIQFHFPVGRVHAGREIFLLRIVLGAMSTPIYAFQMGTASSARRPPPVTSIRGICCAPKM